MKSSEKEKLPEIILKINIYIYIYTLYAQVNIMSTAGQKSISLPSFFGDVACSRTIGTNVDVWQHNCFHLVEIIVSPGFFSSSCFFSSVLTYDILRLGT